MSVIDLQIHTTHSDGLNTPAEVVRMAAENGLSVIAITDHDNVTGVPEAMSAAAGTAVKVIPGIEISTATDGLRLHMLGYGIDVHSERLEAFLKPVFDFRKVNLVAKMRIISDRLVGEGKPPIDIDEFIESQHGYFGRPGAGRFLVEKGIVKDGQESFDLLSSIRTDEKPYMVTAGQAIDAIHSAGGLAVLSHAYGGSISLIKKSPDLKVQDAVVEVLHGAGLDGLECFQSSLGPAETSHSLAVAKRLGLLVTGGSDWHGPKERTGAGTSDYMPNYPDRLGGLDVPTEAVMPFLDRLGISIDKK